MKYQNTKIPLKNIIKVFNQIESADIICLAKKIQKQLITDTSLIKNNDDIYKIVTQADIKIQKLLLDYFGNSSLKGTYQVIAEEAILNKINSKNASWKLLIDPLDGTRSFINQDKTWGVMVGACDLLGVLRYSWNLVSTGKVFTSQTTNINRINKMKTIIIDVFDYQSRAIKKFNSTFSQYTFVEYPAAVWVGWQLYQEKVNGLLWLPSKKGKKWYPDYDLVFLGALFNKGYNIIIGKKDNNNSMIAIGLTLKDAEKLYEIGLSLLPKNQRQKMKKIVNKLKIIN